MKRINQNVDTTLCDTFIQISCRTVVRRPRLKLLFVSYPSDENKWYRFGTQIMEIFHSKRDKKEEKCGVHE